ncbi:hypothetical protein GCM10010289_01630 [Streptomyces violascens]|nr:hypothetical protein GCM10010289_01630 [Streptomyces violascens]
MSPAPRRAGLRPWPGTGTGSAYLQFDGPSYLLGESNDIRGSIPAAANYNDYSPIPGGQFNGGIIWGKPTNWRVAVGPAEASRDVPRPPGWGGGGERGKRFLRYWETGVAYLKGNAARHEQRLLLAAGLARLRAVVGGVQ